MHRMVVCNIDFGLLGFEIKCTNNEPARVDLNGITAVSIKRVFIRIVQFLLPYGIPRIYFFVSFCITIPLHSKYTLCNRKLFKAFSVNLFTTILFKKWIVVLTLTTQYRS